MHKGARVRVGDERACAAVPRVVVVNGSGERTWKAKGRRASKFVLRNYGKTDVTALRVALSGALLICNVKAGVW